MQINKANSFSQRLPSKMSSNLRKRLNCFLISGPAAAFKPACFLALAPTLFHGSSKLALGYCKIEFAHLLRRKRQHCLKMHLVCIKRSFEIGTVVKLRVT